MRDDIGRLAPGMKADLVLLDLDHPQMRPARDLLRSFVYHAAARAVCDMFIDGRQVVANRRVLTLDEGAATARLRAAQQRMEALASSRDYLGRAADEITPLSLPVLEGLLGKAIEGCSEIGDTTEAGPCGMLLWSDTIPALGTATRCCSSSADTADTRDLPLVSGGRHVR